MHRSNTRPCLAHPACAAEPGRAEAEAPGARGAWAESHSLEKEEIVWEEKQVGNPLRLPLNSRGWTGHPPRIGGSHTTIHQARKWLWELQGT